MSTATTNTTTYLTSLRLLTLDDAAKAARTLYQLFRNDALALLLMNDIQDPQLRQAAETKMYECYVRQHILKGVCLGVGEDASTFETVAIFATPTSEDEGMFSFATMMELKYNELWDMVPPATREKFFSGLVPLLHDLCERILHEPRFRNKHCWTLVYVGLVERLRGKGNLRKVFSYMFDRYIDNDPDLICYLELLSPVNIPIYERFNFHLVENIVLGNKFDGAVEGKDFAVMNVMIRGNKGREWRDTTKL